MTKLLYNKFNHTIVVVVDEWDHNDFIYKHYIS